MTRPKGVSRRGFLKTAAAAAAGAAVTLWLPRRSRAAQLSSPVQRVLIVNATGGVRWTATFDGQKDPNHNPWGTLNDPASGKWTSPALPNGYSGMPAPTWGVSRLLVQKPQFMKATGWSSIYAYLSSDDPTHYNFSRPAMSTPWGAAKLPNQLTSFLDLAPQMAVVRVTSDPGGVFDSDHASATHTLVTGFRSGKVGMVTAMQSALQAQLGGAFATGYPLPAVSIGSAGWALGVDQYAKSRPIFLGAPYQIPTVDPGNSVASWGRKMEGDFDASFAAARQAYTGQTVADYVNDKANGDAHIKQLINPALHFSAAGSTALGTLTDGATPVTNDMLAEAFALSSAVAHPGDPYIDCFAAAQSTATPSWSLNQNQYGSSAAAAVRLFQMGAPLVSIAVGAFDSHSNEVLDPGVARTHTIHGVFLARTLTGLEFALKRIADPLDPTRSLWDTTVIFLCSEFGRTVVPSSTDGFNAPNGANGGGSDHGEWSAWPVLGGPVAAGGRLLTDPGADLATNPNSFYPQNRVYATLLAGLGVSAGNSTYLDYGKFAPLAGSLVTGV